MIRAARHPRTCLGAKPRRSWDSHRVADTVWYLQGSNENVEALTDRTGSVVERYEYTPYGKPTTYTGAGTDGKWFTTNDVAGTISGRGNPVTFQGRELDAETGNLDFRNRYFSPQLGRFISRDPQIYGAGDVNLFRFVLNNPYQANDPSGENTPLSNPMLQYLSLMNAGVAPSGLAKRLLYNWFFYNGRKYTLNEKEFQETRPSANLEIDPSFVGSLKQCKGKGNFTKSFSISGTAPAVANEAATLGAFSVNYTVSVECKCDGSWKARGTGSAYDTYDFDWKLLSYVSGDSHRTWSGQWRTMAMSLTNGIPFEVSSDRFVVSQTNQTHCLSMGGSGCKSFGGTSKGGLE